MLSHESKSFNTTLTTILITFVINFSIFTTLSSSAAGAGVGAGAQVQHLSLVVSYKVPWQVPCSILKLCLHVLLLLLVHWGSVHSHWSLWYQPLVHSELFVATTAAHPFRKCRMCSRRTKTISLGISVDDYKRLFLLQIQLLWVNIGWVCYLL